MKKIARFWALLLVIVLTLSCSSDQVSPSKGFIKAKVNGIETVYNTDTNNPIVNFIASNEFHISFQDSQDPYLSWSIDVIGFDLNKVKFPYSITGPFDQHPTFYCNILDSNPANSAYGRTLAGTSTNHWQVTVTILSIEGNHVKGIFEGEGTGALAGNSTTFAQGEFEANLPRIND